MDINMGTVWYSDESLADKWIQVGVVRSYSQVEVITISDHVRYQTQNNFWLWILSNGDLFSLPGEGL